MEEMVIVRIPLSCSYPVDVDADLCTRYCTSLNEDPISLIRADKNNNITTFFRWMLDKFSGVRSKSSLHNYWRRFRLLYARQNNRFMDEPMKRTIGSVSTLHDDLYCLTKTLTDTTM